jgi:hypothetical protein
VELWKRREGGDVQLGIALYILSLNAPTSQSAEELHRRKETYWMLHCSTLGTPCSYLRTYIRLYGWEKGGMGHTS